MCRSLLVVTLVLGFGPVPRLDHPDAVLRAEDGRRRGVEEQVLEAAENCPMSAIIVEDADTGEQLFP